MDGNFLSDIPNAKAFPDYDTYLNIVDALLELKALTRLLIFRLDYLYAEECIAWDRAYRATSGRVSETRRPVADDRQRTKRSERTGADASPRKGRESDTDGDDSAGEGGFEPPIT